MSRLRANQITNENANGAPNFPHGLTVTGIVTASTTNSTSNQIVVGSAVTANSQGIDVTGVVTATSFKGDGSTLTGLNVDATALKDGSGNVIVQASASAVSVTAGKHFNPASTNSTDLGTTSLRWRNIYTADLQMSNEGSQNHVDGTWGSYTIQEGEESLFLINKRNGKKFRFVLEEVS